MHNLLTPLIATQLAWLNIVDDWQRMFIRCAGIAFAVVLMFVETGFRNALFDSNVRVMQEKIDCDIVLRSASRYMFSARQLMPIENVIQARSVAGVRSAEPLYLDNTLSEIKSLGHPLRRVRVLAFSPHAPAFKDFGLAEFSGRLSTIGTAAADVKSKSFYGFPRDNDSLPATPMFELARKRLRLVGLFENGIDFSNDGNLIMSPLNFAHYFPQRGERDPLSVVDYGVVVCQPDVDPQVVVARLETLLGLSVIVESRQSFIQSERAFWSTNTPIGLVFWVGTIIGFVVGMSICYQVLATDINDHLSEFSTLKAMGYSPLFFALVVAAQAILLAIVSFLPGTVIAWVVFQMTNWGTGLDLFLNFGRTSSVLGLTLLMCLLSGIVALRKLLSADPASLY